ncbi:MAG: hypothetical protein AAGA77_26180, partial [Bacteroidota bacterium]
KIFSSKGQVYSHSNTPKKSLEGIFGSIEMWKTRILPQPKHKIIYSPDFLMTDSGIWLFTKHSIAVIQ